ncbi:MAG: FeoA family protein [Candidatus Omnitrophota bacterium]
MKKIPLSHVKNKQKVHVAEIDGGSIFVNRMMSLGIYQGREVTVLSRLALRGPTVVKVGRSIFALGRSMAAKIMVEMKA